MTPCWMSWKARTYGDPAHRGFFIDVGSSSSSHSPRWDPLGGGPADEPGARWDAHPPRRVYSRAREIFLTMPRTATFSRRARPRGTARPQHDRNTTAHVCMGRATPQAANAHGGTRSSSRLWASR